MKIFVTIVIAGMNCRWRVFLSYFCQGCPAYVRFSRLSPELACACNFIPVSPHNCSIDVRFIQARCLRVAPPPNDKNDWICPVHAKSKKRSGIFSLHDSAAANRYYFFKLLIAPCVCCLNSPIFKSLAPMIGIPPYEVLQLARV